MHKSNLLAKIDELDRKAEILLLTPEEDLRHHLKGQLTKLLSGRDLLAPKQQSYCKEMIILSTST
jgi:hypothetical protein